MTRPRLSLVAAVAANRAIGRDNDLPWQLPADLRHFKRLTVGKPVIMGRRTFESINARIGGPLPGRHNIIVTRDTHWSMPGAEAVPNLAEAIAAAGLDPKARAKEIMVIGGAEVYAQAIHFADRLLLTEIDMMVPDADAFFPAFTTPPWHEVSRENHAGENGFPSYAFVTYERGT